MPKFPRLLLLLFLAGHARANLSLGGLHSEQTAGERFGSATFVPGPTGAAQKNFSARGSEASGPGFQFVAIPEPGVFVAIVSGATILIARRRR